MANDILLANKKQNEKDLGFLRLVFGGSLATLLVVFVGAATESLRSQGSVFSVVVVGLTVLALGLVAWVFYTRVVIYFPESRSGSMLTRVLAFVLLAVFVLACYIGKFTLIALALGALLTKSCQLWDYCRVEKLGNYCIRYFRTTSIAYMCLFIAALAFGLGVDLGRLQFPLQLLRSPGQLASQTELLRQLGQRGEEGGAMVAALQALQGQVAVIRDVVNGAANALIWSAFAAAIFLAFKVLVARDSSKRMLEELQSSLNAAQSHAGGSGSVAGSAGAAAPPALGALRRLGHLVMMCRPLVSSLAGLVGGAAYQATAPSPELGTAALVVSSIGLTSAFGFLFNDVYDADRDRIGHPNRAIPKGSVPLVQALVLAEILIATSLSAAAAAGPVCLLINAVTALSLVVYSLVNHRYGLPANAITAAASGLVLVYGMACGSFSMLVGGSAVAVFFYVLGREILLDLRDADADRLVGKASVAVLHGLRGAVVASRAAFIVGTGLTCLIAFVYREPSYVLCVAVLTNALLWVSFGSFVRRPTDIALARFLLASRLAIPLVAAGMIRVSWGA